jgi:ABC-type multidrug transport system ATPase subunit
VQTMVLIPFQLVDVVIFGTITYWSVGLTASGQGLHFLIYLSLLFFYHLNFAQFIRLVCSLVVTETLASPLVGILLMFMVLVCGYVIPKNIIPVWLLWLYWSNPFSWVMSALTINEYTATDYDFMTCTTSGTSMSNCTDTERFGDVVLQERGNSTDTLWIRYTYFFLIGQYCLWILLTILVMDNLKLKKPVMNPRVGGPEGTQQHKDGGDQDPTVGGVYVPTSCLPTHDIDEDNNDGKEMKGNETPYLTHTSLEEGHCLPTLPTLNSIQPSSSSSSSYIFDLPFDSVTLSFQDIWYTIKLKDTYEDIDILKGITGYAEPGTMTALMGSSGAGKTTLLDILSKRKNQGHITGLICLNGKIIHTSTTTTTTTTQGTSVDEHRKFQSQCGYVEQFDTLPSHSTVYESIQFSAAMRLIIQSTTTSGVNMNHEILKKWIFSVMEILELSSLCDHLIGTTTSSSGGGLSFEQRKRVSIGLELVANPSLLFLDEPTTGLDSRGAQIVIRCLQRIVLNGRTVIATIHQPSMTLFQSFHNLLLLRRGGETVYFGPLGENSQNLISYFSSIPDVEPLAEHKNPATWVLECIGAGTSGGGGGGGGIGNSTSGGGGGGATDFHQFYKKSTLCSVNESHVKILCDPVIASLARQDDELAAAATASGDCLPSVIISPFLFLGWGQPSTTSRVTASGGDGDDDDDDSTVYDDMSHDGHLSSLTQFQLLLHRATIFYWRTPNYNFVRMVISVIVAFVFGLTCSEKNYSTDIEVVSSTSVIYMTLLFLGEWVRM